MLRSTAILVAVALCGSAFADLTVGANDWKTGNFVVDGKTSSAFIYPLKKLPDVPLAARQGLLLIETVVILPHYAQLAQAAAEQAYTVSGTYSWAITEEGSSGYYPTSEQLDPYYGAVERTYTIMHSYNSLQAFQTVAGLYSVTKLRSYIVASAAVILLGKGLDVNVISAAIGAPVTYYAGDNWLGFLKGPTPSPVGWQNGHAIREMCTFTSNPGFLTQTLHDFGTLHYMNGISAWIAIPTNSSAPGQFNCILYHVYPNSDAMDARFSIPSPSSIAASILKSSAGLMDYFSAPIVYGDGGKAFPTRNDIWGPAPRSVYMSYYQYIDAPLILTDGPVNFMNDQPTQYMGSFYPNNAYRPQIEVPTTWRDIKGFALSFDFDVVDAVRCPNRFKLLTDLLATGEIPGIRQFILGQDPITDVYGASHYLSYQGFDNLAVLEELSRRPLYRQAIRCMTGATVRVAGYLDDPSYVESLIMLNVTYVGEDYLGYLANPSGDVTDLYAGYTLIERWVGYNGFGADHLGRLRDIVSSGYGIPGHQLSVCFYEACPLSICPDQDGSATLFTFWHSYTSIDAFQAVIESADHHVVDFQWGGFGDYYYVVIYGKDQNTFYKNPNALRLYGAPGEYGPGYQFTTNFNGFWGFRAAGISAQTLLQG